MGVQARRAASILGEPSIAFAAIGRYLSRFPAQRASRNNLPACSNADLGQNRTHPPSGAIMLRHNASAAWSFGLRTASTTGGSVVGESRTISAPNSVSTMPPGRL